MDQWKKHGDIIRWWRTEIAGLSQQELGSRLNVARSAVANWETNTRTASKEAGRIDKAFKADGALEDLLWAFDTPKGIDSGKIWTNEFPGPSSAVWMWIRCPEEKIYLEAEWGLFRIAGELDVGPNGLLVAVGASVEQSPVVAQFSAPVWVDFGRGEIPSTLPNANIVDAVDLVQPSNWTGGFNSILSTELVEHFDRTRPPDDETFRDRLFKPLKSFLGLIETPGYRAVQWPKLSDDATGTERSKFVSLRKARGLSLADTAERLGTMTNTKVGKDTLRRFENGTGEHLDPLLPVAIDHVLGGNGHLAVTSLASGSGDQAVELPPYWHAPVWIDFEGVEASQVSIELHWGAWRRRVEGSLPLLVISHSCPAPLRIVAPNDVRWTVGVGRRSGATPINQNWVPDSVDTTNNAVTEYRGVFLDAVRHANDGKPAI